MNKPLRILHVFGAMNCGGAETLIMNVYRKIDKEKFQFDFAVNTDIPGYYDEEIKALGGRIFYHPSPKSNLVNYIQSFSNTLKSYGPFNAVHSHVHNFSAIPVSIAKFNKVPVRVAHSHSTLKFSEGAKRSIYYYISKKILKLYSTNLLSCSSDAAHALFGKGILNDAKHRILSNGINLEVYENSLENENENDNFRFRKLGIQEKSIIIGHVGSFSYPKNHKFLIELFKNILESMPESHLLLIGDGPLKNEIEESAKLAGIYENVHFLGIRDDIPQLLKLMDVFVFPSLYEGLGIALIEAQAAGIPCIVSNNVPEESNLNTGYFEFLSLNKDFSQWSMKINEALRNKEIKLPSQERFELIKKKGFSVDSTTKILEAIYGQ